MEPEEFVNKTVWNFLRIGYALRHEGQLFTVLEPSGFEETPEESRVYLRAVSKEVHWGLDIALHYSPEYREYNWWMRQVLIKMSVELGEDQGVIQGDLTENKSTDLVDKIHHMVAYYINRQQKVRKNFNDWDEELSHLPEGEKMEKAWKLI